MAWLGEPRRLFDQAVVIGRPGGAEVHLHGGASVVAALRRRLEELGATWIDAPTPVVPSSLAEARARASASHGRLALLGRQARDALNAGTCPPELADELRRVHARLPLGRRLMRPAVVALVGRPNAGKSTLFNALLGRQRALTSPVAGTTRDRVTARLRIRGLPVELQDTAGEAVPSAEGVDLAVHLLSDPEEPVARGPGVLAVPGRADQMPCPGAVSGLTGHGLDELIERIADRLSLSEVPEDHALAPTDPGWPEILDACLELPAGTAGDPG